MTTLQSRTSLQGRRYSPARQRGLFSYVGCECSQRRSFSNCRDRPSDSCKGWSPPLRDGRFREITSLHGSRNSGALKVVTIQIKLFVPCRPSHRRNELISSPASEPPCIQFLSCSFSLTSQSVQQAILHGSEILCAHASDREV